MGFFSKKEHKLPVFPSTIKKVFKSFCIDIDKGKLEILRKKVLEEIENAKKRNDAGMLLDIHLAEEIVKRCLYLIDHFDDFSSSERRLAVGAICYFAVSDDPLSEEIFASGYDDDAKVMNYVLEELKIDDQFIELIG